MAAISQTTVCNMALSHVGAKSHIESIQEKSNEADAFRLWWDFSLLECLESYDWSFARTRTPQGSSLALDGDVPPDEWQFRYQYPADCVKARMIWNPVGPTADAVPFALELNSQGVRTILTNMGNPILVYTKLVTNLSLFIPIFISLLSRCLAQHVAFQLTGDQKIVDAQVAQYGALLRLAPAVDANEMVPSQPRDAEWIRGRTFDPKNYGYPGIRY
ncbi:MAG TPA: hypothetical protein VFE77_03020 [Rhodanobacter sp.]|nr:hypothetical protein [Rhodanobacter sp.]